MNHSWRILKQTDWVHTELLKTSKLAKLFLAEDQGFNALSLMAVQVYLLVDH
jgi:hypothetical protein